MRIWMETILFVSLLTKVNLYAVCEKIRTLCADLNQSIIMSMGVTEEILEQSCTGCPRFSAGACPFPFMEKEYCPRVKETISSRSHEGKE